MRSFTLRTLWKRPETLRTLMARRRVAGIVRLGVSGLGAKDVLRDGVRVAAKAVDAGGAMGAIGIVETVRRCRRIAARRARWKRLGVLLRLRMRCWMRRRVLGKKMRLVRVLRVRMVSAGGVDVADGGVDVGLRVRLRQRRQLGMRRMSLA